MHLSLPRWFSTANSSTQPISCAHWPGLACSASSPARSTFSMTFWTWNADRQHPVKRNRPIASGKLPVPVAVTAGLLLTLAALVAGYLLAWQFALVLLVYFIPDAGLLQVAQAYSHPGCADHGSRICPAGPCRDDPHRRRALLPLAVCLHDPPGALPRLRQTARRT